MRWRTVMVSGKAAGWLVLAAVLCARRTEELSHAQERAAILESVDLFVPLAPASVAISGTTHIVYELHITNLLPVDVSITRIQVTRADSPGACDCRLSRRRPEQPDRQAGTAPRRTESADRRFRHAHSRLSLDPTP